MRERETQYTPLEALQAGAAGEGDVCEDDLILAYLRAAKMDVDHAVERLKETEKWRADVGLEAAMENPQWQQLERDMRSVLLYDFLGCDRWGRPVLVELVGAWDTTKVLAAANDLDKFILLHAMVLEGLVTKVARPEWATDKRGFCIIMDMTGLGWGHMGWSLISVFREISLIDDSHFPDTVHVSSYTAASHRFCEPGCTNICCERACHI